MRLEVKLHIWSKSMQAGGCDPFLDADADADVDEGCASCLHFNPQSSITKCVQLTSNFIH